MLRTSIFHRPLLPGIYSTRQGTQLSRAALTMVLTPTARSALSPATSPGWQGATAGRLERQARPGGDGELPCRRLTAPRPRSGLGPDETPRRGERVSAVTGSRARSDRAWGGEAAGARPAFPRGTGRHRESRLGGFQPPRRRHRGRPGGTAGAPRPG